MCEIGDRRAGIGAQPRAVPEHAQDHRPEPWRLQAGGQRQGLQVIDLIEARRLDEAERRCRLLASRFPEQVDHLERLAEVRNAQGRFAEAATLWQQAAEFARAHEGYDREIIEFYEERSRAAATRG